MEASLHGRRLNYVPIVHSEADMGSLSGGLQKAYINRFGEKLWQEHRQAIDDMWEGIKAKVNKLALDFKKVRLYQDGLPVCGKEKEIVQQVAESGSKNHQLLLELMSQGATLMGTEDPSLLIKEYNRLRGAERITGKAESLELLDQRDNFIARRITDTLLPEETGILFIGLMHRVDEKLSQDIEINYLIHNLPFRHAHERTGNEQKD
ncbi:MAG: hypothetical protein HYR55_14090 [Acidobacteria bacterium]|nr:hypothetical protein [Acidobacteriota bacterium]MBI3654849.1 hypothetical protein [Acidobacteriota bacterium]